MNLLIFFYLRIQRYIYEEFKWRGNLQTNIICFVLLNAYNADDALGELRKMDESIIRNIHLMYSYNCMEAPAKVVEFRDVLYQLLDGKIEATKDNFKIIYDLGRTIQNL